MKLVFVFLRKETNMKKIFIPVFLAALALPLAIANKPQALNASFIGEANDQTAYIAYASKIGAQLADEGFVLLKNEDDFLPFDTDGAKISIAGKASSSILRGGSGSGAGQVNSGVKSFDFHSSLEAVGAEINPTLKAFYANSNKSGSGRTNGNNGWKGNSEVTIGETPIENLKNEDGLLDSLDEYSDFIIQVITREGSEGCDVKTCNTHDSIKTHNSSKAVSHKHALELSDNEQALFDELHEHTDHIIMVVNSSNVFECAQFQDDPQVAAVIWIGNPGDVGPGALGRIIAGEVNPSGRTVDTWAVDFTKDPTFQNFSDNSQTNLVEINGEEHYCSQDTLFNADGSPTMSFGTDKAYNNHASPRWDTARGGEEAKVVQGGINGVKPSAYVAYEEGIYYDYRYYETKYDDMKEAGKDADAWYEGDEGVVYPFGFGLSYTTFEQKIVSSNIANKVIKSGNAEISVKVNVKNTGKVAGKEVVQLYWKAPYYKGGIEKASKVLCAFDKTKLLEPGESQDLVLKFNSQDVANYDFSDANQNEFCGYELDAGDYQIILGKNAHEEIDSIDLQVGPNGIQYENDRFTGHKVENRFTNRGFYNCLPGEDDFEFEQFSREDMDETFPTHPTIESRTLGANSRMEEFYCHEFTMKEVDVDKNFEYVPEAVYKTEMDIKELGWEQGNGKTDVKFTDLLNSDIDDPRWKDFMDQLTYDEMLEYVYGPRSHNAAISRLSKPSTSDSDGPQRYRIMWWVSGPIVAATYNVELAKKQGECVGMEAHLSSDTYGWAGPGVNIHRSPFGGRNFEYYSADPFLTGRIAGRVVGGASDKGVYCFFKHFVVNDQEKNREGTSTFLTEQDLREIYLKPFQMCIQEGKSMGLMSSYNRLGMMETAASYPLLTEVLRDEWGFKGSIISDMTHSGNSSVNFKCYENINNRVLAGCDQQLDNGGGFKDLIDCKWSSSLGCPVLKSDETVPSYSWWYALRTNAQRVIWMCARSGVNSKTLINPLEDVELTNVERGVYVGEVGKDVEIEVKADLSNIDGDVELQIDPFTPLPEGLEFDGEKITGVSEEPVNKFIHIVVVTPNGAMAGVSFELRIMTVIDNAELEDMPEKDNGGKKKGCFGDITSIGMLASVLALAGFGIILLNKKRRVTE